MSIHEMSEIHNQNSQPGPVLHDGPIFESPEPPTAASVMSESKSAQKMPSNASASVIADTPVRKATHQPTTFQGKDPQLRGEPEKKILGITQFQSTYSGNRTYDYEEKYAPDPLGDQAKPNAHVWKVYLDESESYDEDMLRSFRDTMMLCWSFMGFTFLQAALFSGVVTTLLVQTCQAFQPDYALVTTLLLTEQIQLLRAAGNVSTINSVPSSLNVQQAAAASNADIWINALFIASLSLSLATALLSVLVKQWLQAYASVIQGGSAMERALLRQFRIIGLEKWKVSEIIGVLPLILHASLAAFFVGLAFFVRQLNHSFLWIVVAIGTITFGTYLGSIILPAIWIQCPYRITVLFVPAQYLLWLGKVVKYLFRSVQYCWREWRDPDTDSNPPTFPHASANSLRDAERQVINVTGGPKQWKSTTTTQTIGKAISWLYTLESNTSIMNIATQSVFGIMKDLKADLYLDSSRVYADMSLPIPSMFDGALDCLLEHAGIDLPTLTDRQKQNEEIYLELVDGLLQSKPNLLKEPQSQKLTTGGHLETVKFILQYGVDVNAMGGFRDCALAAAAYDGRIEVVEDLLNHGADPAAHNYILCHAVHGGLEIVKLLLAKRAVLQFQGKRALQIASRDGQSDIVKLLIEKGVNPKHTLQTACRSGQLEVVRVLVENGVDLDALGGEWGIALQAAFSGDKSEIVEFLIESGPDVKTRSGNSTPLLLAIRKGHKEIWGHSV
ncbi:hypothetical protein C8J56DRAFT_1160116 [Mycena floridula]|nr:hypothetical protein C8J56DRAFT_1160116 [Mycena floridula]